MGLVHPADRPIVGEARRRVLAGDPRRTVAFRTVLADGSTRHLEAAADAIRDGHGQITRVVGAVQNVSDRKQAEAVLRGSEERLQFELQATGLGPWDWDLTTNVVEFWPERKRQIGYEPHEISNRYEEWESRLHPDDRDRVLTALRAYLDGRLPEYSLEFRLRHKDGTYRWIFTRGVVLRDASGGSHIIGGHLDITERKHLEEQYRQSQKMQAVGNSPGASRTISTTS
jgi:PAS domain S-box-containing protein